MMKKQYLFCVLIFICSLMLEGMAFATDIDIGSTTLWMAYQQERYGTNANLSPIYEYFNVNNAKLFVDGLTLNLSLWGNFQTYDWWEDERADGQIMYGYLKYINPDIGLKLKAGRIFVNAGAAAMMEQLDGVYASYRVKNGPKLEFYGGAQINDRDGSRKGDWMAGTRISKPFGSNKEIGLSYLFQKESERVNYNRVGLDGWYYISDEYNLNGYLAYDLTLNTLADTSINFTYFPSINNLKSIDVDLGYRSTSAFLGSQSLLSVFALGNYINPRIYALFDFHKWSIMPSYEAMIYLEEEGIGNRLSLKVSRFFKDGKYLAIFKVSRLMQTAETNYTELRSALHANIVDGLESDVDIIWDIRDEGSEEKEAEEEKDHGFEAALSGRYIVNDNFNLSLGVSLTDGFENDWQFKGFGKLEIVF